MNQTDAELPPCGVVLVESRQSPGSSDKIKDACSKFCLIVAGHARLECGGRRYLLGPDTLCHVPAGQEHCQETPPNTQMLAYVLRYRADMLPADIYSQLKAVGILPLDLRTANVNQSRVVRSIIQEMLFEQNSGQTGWETVLRSRLMDLAVRTLRLIWGRGRQEMPIFEPGNDSSDRVARYAVRLKSRFFKQESLIEAARSVGLSRRQFTDLFRKVTGQSWRVYVQGLRLRHAAELLASTDRTVIAVAFESGFNDLSRFHHVFKATYGCSPLSFREQRRVRLPAKLRPIAKPDHSPTISPRFKFRGIKGWAWTQEQYLKEIPFIAELKMNFLMDCDGMIYPPLKEWWKPMRESARKAYSSVFKACAEHGITFCFARQPQMISAHLLDATDRKNFEAFYQHYEWAQRQGVKWFGICLDGVSWGSAGPAAGGATHAALVNAVFDRLRAEDEECQFVFCPVASWGDGTNLDHHAYLEGLARDMHPEVYVYWNGDGVVTSRITRVAADSYRKVVKHRLFLWDNYPVNDGSPTLHLGPLTGRDSDLCELVDGYISNPMYPQNEINRLPLFTCADYAHDPLAYSPGRSIGQAILRLAENAAQQDVLKQLVEIYPGFLVAGGGTGTNPARGKLASMLAHNNPQSAADRFTKQMVKLLAQLTAQFPGQFAATRNTIQEDIDWMKSQIAGTR